MLCYRRIVSLQVAKIKGIPIKLHFTLAIVFGLIAWTLAVNYMPLFYPGLPQSVYWTMGILGAIVLFISVLLHELSHSIVAKRYGYKVRQIILFVFGGVSDIRDEPKEEYKKEFTIAIVGPLSSFALAGLFAAVWFVLVQVGITTTTSQADTSLFALPQLQQQEQDQASFSPTAISDVQTIGSIAQGIMRYGIIVNILLGGFNLLPAFPLDGGRVLRAGLMRWKGDYHDATKTAVNVGTAISYGLMAFGFLTIFTGSFTGGIWLILIAWFLQSGAQSYLQQHEITAALSGVRLYHIMNTQFVAVNPSMNIKEVLEGYFNIHRKSELPVVEKELDNTVNNYYYYLLGSVTAKDAMNVSEKNREDVKVEEIMIEKKNLVIMSPDKRADIALNTIVEENKSRIYVCENPSIGKSSSKRTEKMQQEMIMTYTTVKSDRLVGIVSKTDILNVAKERMQYTE